MTGVEIVVSDEVASSVTHKMTLQFEDTPLETILNTVAAFTECSWSERSGGIYFVK